MGSRFYASIQGSRGMATRQSTADALINIHAIPDGSIQVGLEKDIFVRWAED